MNRLHRDNVGYGQYPPNNQWPKEAKIAVNFVINYEEGAENNPLDGDKFHETYGCEIPLSPKEEGERYLSVESLYEYGSRAGVWRLTRLFDKHEIPLTFFITGLALTRNPEFAQYLKTTIHEVAGHGWRWFDYASLKKSEEKTHIEKCIATIQELTGKTVQGWYTGRVSNNTRDIILELGSFIYDSDAYADDIPYFYGSTRHLIVPYSLDCNDFRFTTTPGFSGESDFFDRLKMSFDYLYHEEETPKKMLTIGLHPRISGKPGRCMAIKRFVEYIQGFEKVWIARRIDIANHWLKQF